MNWGVFYPERYPKELMTLFWASEQMAMMMQSSAVHVASSQGMGEPARAGTDWIHWWKEAQETFVSAENGAQWMLACLGAKGAESK